MSCPTNNPKRPATVPMHILEVANLTFDTASPYTRPRSHIGGSGAHRGRDRLLCASVRRETALVCATTVRYKRHITGRSLARTQRLRPRWVPNSQHKAHKGRRAVARAQTLCGRRSHGQRASRRAHRCARSPRPALAALQAKVAPHRWDCHSRTPAGPPKGTQTPFQHASRKSRRPPPDRVRTHLRETIPGAIGLPCFSLVFV